MYSKEPINASNTKDFSAVGGGGRSEFDPTVRIKPIPRLKPTPCCDFCGDDHPVYIYHSFQRTDGLPVIPFGARVLRWAACEQCTQAIDQDDWKTVETRVTARLRTYLRSHGNGMKPPENLVKETVHNVLQTFQREAIKLA